MYLKRFLVVAIASVMSLGFLGACGGTNDSQGEENPAGEMTEEESNEDEGEEESEGEGTETENDD